MKADHNWQPSASGMEIIAEAQTARMSVEWTAARLGVSPDTVAAFAKRLAEARAYEDAMLLMEASKPAMPAAKGSPDWLDELFGHG